MKNKVPWNWIVTSFVLAVFGLTSFWAYWSEVHSGNDNNVDELQLTISILQDSIKEKSDALSDIRIESARKDTEIHQLRTMLKKHDLGNRNANVDNATLNALNKRIREKDAEILRQKNQIQQLKEKLEFLNSL